MISSMQRLITNHCLQNENCKIYCSINYTRQTLFVITYEMELFECELDEGKYIVKW